MNDLFPDRAELEQHRKECLGRFARTVLVWTVMRDESKRAAFDAYVKEFGRVAAAEVIRMVKSVKAGKTERKLIEGWLV